MPILDVPEIRYIYPNWKNDTIDVTIISHKYPGYYEITGKFTNFNKTDNDDNPFVYTVEPFVRWIPQIKLEVVQIPSNPMIEPNFGHPVPLHSGSYLCNITARLGWWKRVLYWRGIRNGFGFAAFKLMFIPDPAYPILTKTQQVDWQ